MIEFDKEWMFLVVKWPLIVIILALLFIGLWNVVQYFLLWHNKKAGKILQKQAVKEDKEISVVLKKIKEIKSESW